MSHRHEFKTTMQLGCFLECGCRASWAERCSECGSASWLPPQVRQRPTDRLAGGQPRSRLVATAAGRKHHKIISVSASQHDVCSSNLNLWVGSMTACSGPYIVFDVEVRNCESLQKKSQSGTEPPQPAGDKRGDGGGINDGAASSLQDAPSMTGGFRTGNLQTAVLWGNQANALLKCRAATVQQPFRE